MSTRIDEIKKSFIFSHSPALWTGIEVGFDAAMDLQLPVRFATWKDKNANEKKDGGRFILKEGPMISFDYPQLYTYWLQNIYQP